MTPKTRHYVVLRLFGHRPLRDKKSKEWTIPVLVALISGFFAIVSIFVQVVIQNESQKNITRLIEQEKTLGRQTAEAKFTLRKNLSSLMIDIDRSFEQLCNFPSGKRSITQKALTASLAKYREQLDSARTLLPSDSARDIETYSEFVAERQYEIRFSKIRFREEQCKHYYQESQELRRKAEQALANI